MKVLNFLVILALFLIIFAFSSKITEFFYVFTFENETIAKLAIAIILVSLVILLFLSLI
ncbi:MAG: hypothetical protein QXG80_01385 [Nanopusillaceae archaeon]